MLGVGGAIYKSVSTALRVQLGVDGPRLRQLLTELHFIAVTGLNRIWRQRQALLGTGGGKAQQTRRHRHGGRPAAWKGRRPKRGKG